MRIQGLYHCSHRTSREHYNNRFVVCFRVRCICVMLIGNAGDSADNHPLIYADDMHCSVNRTDDRIGCSYCEGDNEEETGRRG